MIAKAIADFQSSTLMPMAAEKGISTASGEFISWAELKPYLCALNEISRLNLLVVMAACNGADLAKVILPTDRAPVWAMIGPPRPVEAGRILDGFKAFYNTLLDTHDGKEALNSLNGTPDVKDWKFIFTNAEFFFISVYKGYLESLCTESVIAERAKKIAEKIIQDRPTNSNDKRRMLAELNDFLKSTQQPFFEEHKARFFMIDLFKENENRFQITFEQCKAGLEAGIFPKS